MSGFVKDDLVRLTPRYVRSMHYKGHRTPTDWTNRQGTVIRANVDRVMVLWPGRTSLDDVPPRALEKV